MKNYKDTTTTLICKEHIYKCRRNIKAWKENLKEKNANVEICELIIATNSLELEEFEHILNDINRLRRTIEKLKKEVERKNDYYT